LIPAWQLPEFGPFSEGFHEGLLGDVLGRLVVPEGSPVGVAVDGWGVVEVSLR
jgi:hypothetical protein